VEQVSIAATDFLLFISDLFYVLICHSQFCLWSRVPDALMLLSEQHRNIGE